MKHKTEPITILLEVNKMPNTTAQGFEDVEDKDNTDEKDKDVAEDENEEEIMNEKPDIDSI